MLYTPQSVVIGSLDPSRKYIVNVSYAFALHYIMEVDVIIILLNRRLMPTMTVMAMD